MKANDMSSLMAPDKRRKNRIEVKFSSDEQALLEAAAAISHPTAKGANVARMIREASLKSAKETVALGKSPVIQ